LPCADFQFLTPLKRSAQYGAVRKRVSNLKPLDAWQANGVHYFVFELRPAPDATTDAGPAFALFSMGWEYDGPAMALVISLDASGDQAEIVNLDAPELVQQIALSDG
jgi:hypothetical protein